MPLVLPLVLVHLMNSSRFFDSRSTKTMTHCSAFLSMFQSILDLPPLRFQTLGRRTTPNEDVDIAGITFPEFNSNIFIDSHAAYLFNEICLNDMNFGSNFLNKFRFTNNYNENILQWTENKILFNNLDECFNTSMSTDLNVKICHDKEDSMLE